MSLLTILGLKLLNVSKMGPCYFSPNQWHINVIKSTAVLFTFDTETATEVVILLHDTFKQYTCLTLSPILKTHEELMLLQAAQRIF